MRYFMASEESFECSESSLSETEPSFPGGEDAFEEWLSEHQQYPAECADAGIWGVVTVEFVVDEEGRLSDAKVTVGVHPLIDAEALRLIASSPDWIPGKKNGVAVQMRHSASVEFALRY
jgi:TonB family protein